MSVQPKTSLATDRGNAQAVEDISLAGSPSPATNGGKDCSSLNSVSSPEHKSPDRRTQADENIDEEFKLTLLRQSGRIEAAQFDLPLEETRQLPVDDIHADPEVQVRAQMDAEAVENYAERMREGDTFPAVVVFNDGTQRWLADGFHRLAAIRQTDLETITAKVRRGGRREAVRYALGANVSHGLHRTSADKRRAIEIALKEFPDPSDRVIAEMCGVGNQLVGNVRRQVCESHTSSVRIGLDGKKYTQKKPSKKDPQPEAGPDQAPTNSPPLAKTRLEPDAPNLEGPVADQERPAAFEFLLADRSDFGADAWTDGWIDAKAAATKIRSLETTAKPLVSVDKEACTLHQRILLGYFSTLNRELGPEPSHDALHRLHDVLDNMACLVRNTVVGHRNYHPAVGQLQPPENASYADDNHND